MEQFQEDSLRLLVFRLMDDQLTAEEFLGLEELLFRDTAARGFFIREIDLLGNLYWDNCLVPAAIIAANESRLGNSGKLAGSGVPASALLADEAVPGGGLPGIPNQSRPPSVLGFLTTAGQLSASWLASPKMLTITVFGGLATYFVGLMISIAISRAYVDRGPNDLYRPTAEAFAQLTATADCRWRSGSPRTHAPLPRGSLELESGTAELTFTQGTRVIVEGPALLEVVSARLLRLDRGKLVARVTPRAIGFTVTTPSVDVVDLGTEFGVEVDEKGKTDVHVLEGKVEVTPGNVVGAGKTVSQKVVAGQAVRVVGPGQAATPIPVDRRSFAGKFKPTTGKGPTGRSSDAATMKIWLGNLFDDHPHVPLADAMRSDTFCAAADSNDLGVCKTGYGSETLQEIAPGIGFDFEKLGWEAGGDHLIANDAWSDHLEVRPKVPAGGIRLSGDPMSYFEPRIDEGIGMHASAFITFDLDDIRAAGGLQGRTLEFHCDRAGVNDDAVKDAAGSIHMAVIYSTSTAVQKAIVDGAAAQVVKSGSHWSLATEPGKPLRSDGHFFQVHERLPPDVQYLTLACTNAGDGRNYDHGVWIGARLEVAP